MVVSNESVHAGSWKLEFMQREMTSSDGEVGTVNVWMVKERQARDLRCVNILEGEEGTEDKPVSEGGQ